MKGAATFAAILGKIRPLPFGKTLYRGIRFGTLLSKTPPEPLYASGAQNRYNLKGTRALYFGENVLTAYAETVQLHAGLLLDSPTRERQASSGFEIAEEGEEPIVIFAATVWLEKTLDLTDAGVLSKLELTEDSMMGPWRWAASTGQTPLTQSVGDAAYQSGRFEAIRYRSEKSRDSHRVDPLAAWVVFIDRLSGPSFIKVSDVSRHLQARIP